MKKEINIFLIGPMGAGKSTVGRHLADILNRPFLDVDTEIERYAQMTIHSIFALEQEMGFRQREAALIAELTQKQGLILATGGGCVTLAENRQHLLSSGIIIYLQVSLTQQKERLQSQLSNRPLLTGKNPLQKLAQLNQEREFWYRTLAHLRYDTDPFADSRLLAQQIAHDLKDHLIS